MSVEEIAKKLIDIHNKMPESKVRWELSDLIDEIGKPLEVAVDQFHRVGVAERHLTRARSTLESYLARLNKDELAEYARRTIETDEST